MTQTVNLQINHHIATISFNRPQHMNAYNQEMAYALAEITNQVKLAKDIRAVLLRGEGKLFMAGGDIHFFHAHAAEMPGPALAIMRALNATIHNLQQMDKPVLAMVHGSAAGVGLSLCLACDLVIAETNTKFTTAYSKIGLSPDGGLSYFLTQSVGSKKAMELLLLAETFDAITAKNLGLVNWIVPADELVATTEQLLQKLVKSPAGALAKTKQLVNHAHEQSLATHLEAEVAHFCESTCTADFKEGIRAFVEKRPANFNGETP